MQSPSALMGHRPSEVMGSYLCAVPGAGFRVDGGSAWLQISIDLTVLPPLGL